MAYVNIDLYSQITPYNQEPNYKNNCAAVCGCMMAKVNPDGIPDIVKTIPAPWQTIADESNMTANNFAGVGLSSVVKHLKNGNPCAVKVNEGDKEHWVTAYGFEGNDTAPTANDIKCVDPYGKKTIRLASTLRYAGVFNTCYFD